MKRTVLLRLMVLMVMALGVARAADDTAKFYGQWKTSVKVNGQVVTIISVHDESGYTNYVLTPAGPSPAGSGAFHAANGFWTAAAAAPNQAGTYLFTGKNAVVCTNSMGQTVTWVRDKTPLPNAGGATPAQAPAPVGDARPAPKAGGKSEVEAPSVPPAPPEAAPDPSLSPATRAAIEAFNKKDYRAAWDNFMMAAKQGDAEAEAGLGAMLFNNVNPPGTGFYAQAEHWLQLSANQGNGKGMDYLAQFYYRNATNIAGGINPGVNHTRIPPQEQAQADALFKKARMWFERSAEKGDGYAMGNLAILLDAGVGGPADPKRAEELRAEVKKMNDPHFIHQVTDNPETLAMKASWLSGHFEEAIAGARSRADQGDAHAQAMLGRAYFEGLGVRRDLGQAKHWLDLAVAQNEPDGMFFLGLMYEHGWGVPADEPRGLKLFDRAAALGQHYADMEAKGMRMQMELNKPEYQPKHGVMDTACGVAGGTMAGFECLRGGSTIDPFAPWQNESN